LVGIAQVRRRHAALFQFGILLRDQSALADYLQVPDESTREKLRAVLRQRTVGLESLLDVLALEPDQFL
jgi:lipoate-protein ligase A